MNYFLIGLVILSSNIYAQSLKEVINKSISNNHSLEAINYRILANKSKIKSSGKLNNPIFSLLGNDLDRDKAMSNTTINIQQKLPYYGKRGSLEKIAFAQGDILSESLELAKVDLVKEIKLEAYRIWELEELYKIIVEHENLTRQNIDLFESYTVTSNNQHMGIISAELTLTDLCIKKRILKTKIKKSYIRISYLASFKVKDLNLKLIVGEIPSLASLKEGLTENKSVAIKEKELIKRKAILKKSKLDIYPDLNLMTSYSYRENFDDFMSFGIGFSLPIYGTENTNEEEDRVLALTAESLKEDTKVQINSQLEEEYIQMNSSYEIYHIIQDDALPKIGHMFELSISAISTGTDLFKYIDVLEKKLKLKQKKVEYIANYNSSIAKIEALLGEIK